MMFRGSQDHPFHHHWSASPNTNRGADDFVGSAEKRCEPSRSWGRPASGIDKFMYVSLLGFPYAPCMEYLPTFALKITQM